MEFEWDEVKFRSNLEKHGVAFDQAARIFNGPVLRQLDPRSYAEERYSSIGRVGEEFYVVVHTERDGAIRIISAWFGGRRERRAYYTHFAR